MVIGTQEPETVVLSTQELWYLVTKNQEPWYSVSQGLYRESAFGNEQRLV